LIESGGGSWVGAQRLQRRDFLVEGLLASGHIRIVIPARELLWNV
jgi:hypothetical protein